MEKAASGERRPLLRGATRPGRGRWVEDQGLRTVCGTARLQETLYEPVLLACALADTDQLGQFQQSAVAKPLSQIVNRTPPYSPATFAFHMNKFCDEKREKVLEKTGPARNIRYKFSDVLMQPYVIIRAMKDGRFPPETLNKFIPQRQLSLGV
jgi:hypothetical protein